MDTNMYWAVGAVIYFVIACFAKIVINKKLRLVTRNKEKVVLALLWPVTLMIYIWC